MYKIIAKSLSRIVLLFIIIIGLIITFPKIIGIKPLEIKSGSMEPKLKVGGIVYIIEEKYENLKVGDVITYKANGNYITHRIVEIGKNQILCKGDNNKSVDPWNISKDNIVGKEIFYIPYLGAIKGIIHNKYGLIVFVALIITCLWVFNYTTLSKKYEK